MEPDASSKEASGTVDQKVPLTPAELEMPDGIFNFTRPKDIRDGLSNGVTNILKGAVGGAAMMVAAPIKGAYDGSATGALGAAKGFGVGLGMGILGGVSMTVGGAISGVYQIGRGLINTPTSVSSSTAGKYWDDEKRVWIYYNLSAEAAEVLSLSEEEFAKKIEASFSSAQANGQPTDGTNAASAEPQAPAKKVADTEYYDILGVPPHATTAEIKKAYYQKAKAHHPDRHPGDPKAHETFQRIGQAYQILSDDNLRANYDSSGKDEVEGHATLDSNTLFAMIFGSEKFVPLIGELKLTTQLQMADQYLSNDSNRTKYIQSKVMAFKQKRREVQCAVNLAAKLQPFVDSNGNRDAFIGGLMEEVRELSGSALGCTLLATIGSCYVEHARSELDTLSSLSVGLNQAGRGLLTNYTIAKEGIQAALLANEVNKLQKKSEAAASFNAATAAGAAPSNPGAASPSAEEGGEAASPSANASTAPRENPADSAQTTSPSGSAPPPPRPAEDVSVMAKKVEKLSGHMFTVMWYVTEMDIRSTLAAVCKKVTSDYSVDDRTRILRCQAMLILGGLFQAHGGSARAGLVDIKSRMAHMNGAEASGRHTDGGSSPAAENTH